MPGDFDPSRDQTGSRYEYQGQVDPFAPSVSNGQITPEEWAQYEARRRRNALLGTLGILGGMAGAQPLANVLGIGAGGAGAVGGSASVPGAIGSNVAPLGGGTVTGTLASAPFGSLAPYAGTVAGVGPKVIGAGGEGINHAMGKFLGMNPRDLLSLAAGVTGTIGGALSPKPNMAPNTTTQDPQLAKLLASMQGRLDKSEPLVDSIFSMANGLLPTQYQKKGGGGMP